jgi:hypothetical protein
VVFISQLRADVPMPAHFKAAGNAYGSHSQSSGLISCAAGRALFCYGGNKRKALWQ